MAIVISFYFNSRLLSSAPNFDFSGNTVIRRKRGRRISTNNFLVALSTHSNPKIMKTNRKNRYGHQILQYDNDDEFEEDWEDDDDDDEDEDEDADLFFSDDESDDEFDPDLESFGSEKKRNKMKGRNMVKSRYGGRTSMERNSKQKLKTRKSAESRFPQLSAELDMDEKWIPLLDYLSTFGLKESHFIQIYERHMSSLQINVTSAKERLEFLQGIGVKHKDIRKIILRQPQILGYTVESNLKSHVAFLIDLGIPQSRIAHIITASPSLFSYSVEQSLKPTVRYLIEEVGIKRTDLSKVVQLSPQILVQRIDNSWNTRLCFLTKELGAPRDSIVKMVKKHPQLLHYSIEDGILPRINFLRSIGMRNAEILKVLTSLTQVLSLSLEDNLKPKYLYLVNDLRNEVQSLTKYPTYLSLSLDQRIRPRHRFLVSLNKAPKGPFPLSSFVPTDESFCQQWAGTSLDKYLAFRQSLLLKEFAKKYEKKR